MNKLDPNVTSEFPGSQGKKGKHIESCIYFLKGINRVEFK